MILISQELPSVMLFYGKYILYISLGWIKSILYTYCTDISVEIKIKFVSLVKKKKISESFRTVRCNKYISMFNPYEVQKVISIQSIITIPIFNMYVPLHNSYIKGFENKCGIGIKCEIMKILNRISTHSSDFLIHEN